MDLESRIAQLEEDTANKITRTSKQRIQETINFLTYTSPTSRQSQRIEHVRARLHRRDNNGLAGYTSMTHSLDGITGNTKPLDAYTVLNSSPKNYVTRFENIHKKMESGISHKDAVHCLDYLESNNYLQRKLRNNTEFKKSYSQLHSQLQKHVRSHERKTTRNHYKAKLWNTAQSFARGAMYFGYGLGLGYFVSA